MLEKLLPYFALLKPVKLPFAGAVLCGLIFGVASGFSFPIVIGRIAPEVFGENPPSGWILAAAVSVLPIVFLIRGFSGFFNTYLLNYCGLRVLEDLRLRVFEKLQRLPMRYFHDHSRGDLLSRTMNDTLELKNSITRIANDILMQPVTLVAALCALVYLSIRQRELVFIIFALLLVPFCAVLIRFIGAKLFQKAKRMQEDLGAITDYVNDNLGAVREVRAFNIQDQQAAQFADLVRSFFKVQMKVVKYTRALSPAIEFIGSIGVGLAIYYASQARIGLEDVVALLAALYMSYDPIKRIGAIHTFARRGLASLNRLEDILNAPEDIVDRPGALPLDRTEGHFCFENVSFDYGEGEVLRDLKGELPAGRVYALVGPSGAGKSTFVNLLPRLYDVTTGSVSLDGQDIRDIRVGDLRDQFALVPQDPVLFNDTISNNIRLSRNDATDAEVHEAARKAHAHTFVESMEKGYDTIVGDRGSRLSGGQKQRVALARAYLKNAPILILDEATSALDSESEQEIQLALHDLIIGKTVIIIAHRLGTIQMADEILVFEDGRIVDRGTHSTLFERCRYYRSVYEMQRA
jgi:subfamily B ATP-binding cassette protein MsbA